MQGTKTLDIILGGVLNPSTPSLLGGQLVSNGGGGLDFVKTGSISVLFDAPVAGFGFDILGLDANESIIGDTFNAQSISFFMGMVLARAVANIQGFTPYAAADEPLDYAIDNMRVLDTTKARAFVEIAVGGNDLIFANTGNDLCLAEREATDFSAKSARISCMEATMTTAFKVETGTTCWTAIRALT